MAPTREQLTSLLDGFEPEDDKERADLATMRRLLAELDAPFSAEQAVAHFTASTVVVDPEGTRVCLVHHRKLKRWLQPGGHLEATDATVEDAALREVREETGLASHLHPRAKRPLDVDVHVIPARGASPSHLHLDVRFLAIAEDPRRLSAHEGETLGARWFPFAEALAAADEAPLRRMLRKAMRVVATPEGA